MQTPKLSIVEDELSILQLYKTKFEREGFEVATASNGRDGLKVIKRTMPDLVLLDLRMPGMQGDEMLARLRAEEWGASIRVIILTNLSRDEAPSSLRFLAVDRYIVKAHHTPSQVVAIVREVLGIK
jgi:DNA-binding response OmpR family regulator